MYHDDRVGKVSRRAISWGEALPFWLKLGFISFGGPAGQIAIMHRELVEVRRWISERRFLHALNYCMLLPGPEAQQLATYLGWLMHGTWGGVAAGVLFILPSLVILIALSWVYAVHSHVPAIAGVLAGVKPAVVAIVFFAAWRIGTRTLKSAPMVAIAAAAFLALMFKVPFPVVILAAALLGYLLSRLQPDAFGPVAHTPSMSDAGHAPAMIDDDTPTPAHARFSARRLLATMATCLALGSLAYLGASLAGGNNATFTDLGTFFTKAALLTFGGAYAVLPYVFKGAVESQHWLSVGQMIDGLALGETTPGPLIMVVAYVGFLAGWNGMPMGPEAQLAAAVIGAMVATFFTFLPSFLFILAGGPLIERTHNELRFVGPLTGITAAVVGVIIHLGVFFAWHVGWPHGDVASLPLRGVDVFAVAVFALAAVALLRFKAGIISVIGLAATLGALATLSGWR